MYASKTCAVRASCKGPSISIRPKVIAPVTTETWWQKHATGPRDGAALNAEAWRRFPGTDHGNVLLKMWVHD